LSSERSGFDVTFERFTGFAGLYDENRPRPPEVLGALLPRIARTPRPGLVVDLGCGTGLSTRFWADRAERVVGVEPTADMRGQAERRTSAANVSFREGFGHRTGLPDDCADIVTCVQALHWMDPRPTFAEVARVLRPAGVFAACDYDWPPVTPRWEVDATYEAFDARVERLEADSGVSEGLRVWSKDGHLARMHESGRFRYVREIFVHHTEMGTAGRLIGLARSQGSVAALLKNGLSESEIGLEELAAVAERTLGNEPQPWHWSARVRLGIA
jgi:SAM-dependent methyltransferase